MGTPETNPHGYEISSVMHHVNNLTGHLMLVHGLIDENVHFRHTARFDQCIDPREQTVRLDALSR